MGENKKRDKSDNLDITVRLALNNIFNFCKQINEITNKKITFTFLYDMSIVSNIVYGDNKIYFLNKDDYLMGVNAIYKYIENFNDNLKIQIREWDVVGDGFLDKMQTDIFFKKNDLENEFILRKKSLELFFTNPLQFEFKLNDFKAKFFPINTDPKQTCKWLKKIYPNKLRNLAKEEIEKLSMELDKNIELFKLLDINFSIRKQIIRLSPHEKEESEINKFGFSFFPGTCIMSEPWTSNLEQDYPSILKKQLL